MSVTIEVGKPCLPQDIIEEILSRLPAKSVGRFRCVSKSWHHLTTQPDFIDSHLKRQRQKLISSSIRSFFSLDYEGQDVVPLELDFPLNYPHNQGPVDMFGSCNGLVCTMPQPLTFVIFNPCTGESLRIPHFPVSSLPCDSCIYYFNAHSFGYAPSIKDYKFVTIYEQIVFAFSLKTKTWKRVQDLPYMYLKRDPGTHLNGAIHWLCQDPGGHPVIAALDLAEEKFSILSPPESVRDDREYKTGVLRGCLCLLQRNEGNWPSSFWIMEEYGVKESWKRFLIGTGRRTSLSSRPLCYWKNTKVLLLRNQLEILLGNPKNGSCKGFLDYGSLRMVFDSDLYVESLVSPNFPKKKCSCNHVKPKLQHCTRFSSTASASLLNYCNKLG